MAQCKHCGTELATGQMRKSPKGGYICRDKIGCKHDRKARLAGRTPGPRSLQNLLRF